MSIGAELTKQRIESFYSDYMEKLYYFCLKKTGSTHEAEDLTSDITVNVISELQKGVIPVSFSAYIWKIARNRYSVWADKKHRLRESVSGTDISECEIADGSSLENEFLHSEDIRLLRRELALISREYRETVVAYYIDGLRIKDISMKLGIPEGTVKAKLFRCRNILKEGMNMAREFGVRSYKPENVDFRSSGIQPSGLPWRAVNRILPVNILLEASNNPSTLEDLSIELGIAMPYMEEEVALLVNSYLLRKLDNGKYITDFYIADKETQLAIYNTHKKSMLDVADTLDKVVTESIPEIRKLNIIPYNMSDMDFKWLLTIMTLDFLINSSNEPYDIYNPFQRENGENWGFMGQEIHNLIAEPINMGHNGTGNSGSHAAIFWEYIITSYNLSSRNEKCGYNGVILLCDIIKKNRAIGDLSAIELHTLRELNEHMITFDSDFLESVNRMDDEEKEKIVSLLQDSGNKINEIIRSLPVFKNAHLVSQIPVFRGDAKEKMYDILKSHPDFGKVSETVDKLFNEVIEILKANSNSVLHEQINYYATMFMCQIRMICVNNFVETGKLILPEDIEKSVIGMYLEIN